MGSVTTVTPHPFDPLSLEEIETVIAAVKKAHGDVFFNVVSLHEPRKAEMTAWLEDPEKSPRPVRVADVVVIAPGGKVFDGLVDVKTASLKHWEQLDGLQPIVSPPTILL
jgi:primary-amine oxidase